MPAKAHLVGAAGAGMRSLADVLLGLGWELTGSDARPTPWAGPASAAFPLRTGHAAEHLPPDAALVVHSDAVPPCNAELARAAQLGIPTLTYFQMLGRLMLQRRGLAVAGTHGKSTTSAMLAQILLCAGLDPTVCYGAAPLGRSSGGRAGRGQWMVAEACEYRANFLHLRPRHAAILNIEPDHFDCYGSAGQLEEAFGRFARLLPRDGTLAVPVGSAGAMRAAQGADCRVETFGLKQDADWRGVDLRACRGRYGFSIVHKGRPVCGVSLRVPGLHNAENALAASALAWAAGAAPEDVRRGLESFRGLCRRLETRGAWRGVTLVDDYAHHPTEVAASLAALRQHFPGRRICCVFQPHQALRTARLLDELAASLHNADVVLVDEIYRAREPAARPGEVTAADLAGRIRAGKGDGVELPALHAPGAIVAWLESALRPGDVLVTMGAGDVRKIADELVERFREDRAAG